MRVAIAVAALCLAAATALPSARPAWDAAAQDCCGAAGDALPPARAGKRARRAKRLTRNVGGAALAPACAVHGSALIACLVAACGLELPVGRALPASQRRVGPAPLAPAAPRVARAPPLPA